MKKAEILAALKAALANGVTLPEVTAISPVQSGQTQYASINMARPVFPGTK